MNRTSIEWTDSTWNPLRGCSRVSEGCRNCYAERQANRQKGPGAPYEDLVHLVNGHPTWTGKVEFVEHHLLDPLQWKAGVGRPRRIFVNSMSDLFHENVPDEWIDKIFAVMALCPQHIFQVLTKRPQRMLEYFTKFKSIDVRGAMIGSHFMHLQPKGGPVWEWSGLPMPNVWLGVSVENQKAADERIPLLLETPAAIRFLSCEPLLGPLDIRTALGLECRHGSSYVEPDTNATICCECEEQETLSWVIAGGESGPCARVCDVAWIRDLAEQCRAAAVPVFVKQLGAQVRDDSFPFNARNFPGDRPGGWTCRGHWRSATEGAPGGPILYDRKGGEIEHWPEDLRIREFPEGR